MKRLIAAVTMSTAAELAGIGLMVTAVWLIMRAADQPPLSALTVAIVTVRTLAIARGTLRYVERLTSHDAVLRGMVELRGRIYDSLVKRPPPLRSGDALTRLVSDVDALQDAILRCLLPAATATLVGVIALAATGFPLPLITGLILAVLLIPLSAYALAAEHLRTLAPLRADLADRTVTLREGAAELTAFGAMEHQLTRTASVIDDLAAREKRASIVTAALTALAVATQFGTALTLLIQGSPAHIVLGAVATLELTIPLTAAAQRWAEIRGSLSRVEEVLTPRPEPARTPPPLHIEPGKRIGIVGPSGAGKSTLLRSIAAAHPGAAKGALADAHVFHRTARVNVQLADPDATEEQLDHVARLVDLDVDWDAVVGEQGDELSGGQRQRLLLARALLANPDILLLDEPVEGLTIHHGDEVLSRVLGHVRTHAKTVVLVTHRLAPLQDFDEIVVIEDGRITQRGTHAELTTTPGYYQDRWSTEHLGTDAAGRFPRPHTPQMSHPT